METDQARAGLAWQIGVWNRISDVYLREIDRRFAPVVEHVIARASLTAGKHILDLGTGTGAVAERAAQLVGPHGHVLGVDISPDMLTIAQGRVAARGLTNVSLREGRAEAVPAEEGAFDVVLASLSLRTQPPFCDNWRRWASKHGWNGRRSVLISIPLRRLGMPWQV